MLPNAWESWGLQEESAKQISRKLLKRKSGPALAVKYIFPINMVILIYNLSSQMKFPKWSVVNSTEKALRVSTARWM